MESPAEWLSRYRDSQAYTSCWRTFEKWLDGKGLTWQTLLTKEPGEIRNVIDKHLFEISPSRTSNSIKFANACIRSFFSFNDVLIPKPHVSLLGGRTANVDHLRIHNVRDAVVAAKPKARSFLLFKFQSLQDNKRMLWISKHSWPQIKPQLEKGGWTDDNRNLWRDVIRIDIPTGRKKNPKPFFCFVGKESIDALKKYLEIRGEPKPGELIWEDLSTTDSITRLMLRLSRQMGLVSRKMGEHSGVRYGFNIHDFRDVASSKWDFDAGANKEVRKFMMGHTIDQDGYVSLTRTDTSKGVKEFLKAQPYLSLFETEKVTIEKTEKLESQATKQADEMKELRKKLEILEAIVQPVKTDLKPSWNKYEISQEVNGVEVKVQRPFPEDAIMVMPKDGTPGFYVEREKAVAILKVAKEKKLPHERELELMRASAISPTELETKWGFEHSEKALEKMIKKQKSKSKTVA